MKKVAIVQSNYLPWKGYFDLIAAVDEFIFYDDVQYTRRDWRNRNRIMTPSGPLWITVPVVVKGRYLQLVREVEIADQRWAEKHWQTLRTNYRRAAHFDAIAELLAPIYLERPPSNLSQLNQKLIRVICEYLGIGTRLRSSSEFQLAEGASNRLASLCEQVAGDVYLSGPAAKAYLDEAAFSARGIAVQWFDYDNYPPYPQLSDEFVHTVSIVDLLFNCGPQAPHYMKHVR